MSGPVTSGSANFVTRRVAGAASCVSSACNQSQSPPRQHEVVVSSSENQARRTPFMTMWLAFNNFPSLAVYLPTISTSPIFSHRPFYNEVLLLSIAIAIAHLGYLLPPLIDINVNVSGCGCFAKLLPQLKYIDVMYANQVDPPCISLPQRHDHEFRHHRHRPRPTAECPSCSNKTKTYKGPS